MEIIPPLNSVFANIYVSYYKNFSDTMPLEISLYALLNSDKHRAQITGLRLLKDENEQRTAKEGLPGFTISARMKKGVMRSEAAIYRHSGFISIDIDRKHNEGVANFFELKDQFQNLPFVACCKTSCRGEGYFLVIPIEEPEKHALYFKWLTLFFKDAGLKIDTAVSNPSAFRFVSYDEKTYFNHYAERLKYYYVSPKTEHSEFTGTVDAEGERANVEYCLTEIFRLKIDVTEATITTGGKDVGGYTTWFYIGCCFAGTFGSDGKEYFRAASQFYPKYDETETDSQFEKCLKWKDLKPGMKVFYDACKAHNVLYKNRPGYLPNRVDVTQNQAPVSTVPVGQNLTKPDILTPIFKSENAENNNEELIKVDILAQNNCNCHEICGELNENQQKEAINRTLLAFENWILDTPSLGIFSFDNQTFRVTLR